MSQDAAIQTRSPLGIGVFWFTTLLGATALWTGLIHLPAEFRWHTSSPADGVSADPSPGELSDPFQAPVSNGPEFDVRTGLTQFLENPFDALMESRESGSDGSAAGFEPGGETAAPQSMTPVVVPSGPEMSLLVETPERVAVDGVVMVRIRLNNTTAAPAENITVTGRFDDHFEFAGSNETSFREPLGRLAPGQSRELRLSLTARRAGRGCLQLQVSSSTHADLAVERCLDIRQSATVSVSIVGPQRRTVGSRAEYVITCINETGSDVPAAAVTIAHDVTLKLREVSAGAQSGTGSLHWDLGTLLDGERIQIQVEFECESVVPSALLAAAVTSESQSIGAAESRLRVSGRSELELRISDTADPLEAGQQSTFLLAVENHSPDAARDVVVHLVPSRNIEVTRTHVRRDGRELQLNAFVAGNGLYFQAAPPLEPGGRLTYEIEFNALAPGVGELRAILQSRMLPAPLEVSESLVINAPATGA